MLTRYKPTSCAGTAVRATPYKTLVPTMGIKQAIIVTRQRRSFHLAAKKEKMIEARVDITPVGMARRDDCTEVKPRFLIMMPLKVVSPILQVSEIGIEAYLVGDIPPLGMLIAMLKKKMSHVFGSINASIT